MSGETTFPCQHCGAPHSIYSSGLTCATCGLTVRPIVRKKEPTP